MLTVTAIETDGESWTQTGTNVQKYFHDTEAPDIIISPPIKQSNNDITNVEITVTDNVDLFASGVKVKTDSTTAGYKDFTCETDENDKSIVHCSLTITGSGKLVIRSY